MDRESSLLDKILGLLPGYTGYAGRESRRRDDARVRDRVVTALRRCERHVDDCIRAELQVGNTDQAEALERCRKKLNTLSSRVNFSPVGTTPFMSDKTLTETELQKVISSDLALMEGAILLEERLGEFNAHDLLSIIQRLSDATDERNTILQELK